MQIIIKHLLFTVPLLTALAAYAQEPNPPLLPYPHRVNDHVFDLTKNEPGEMYLLFIGPDEFTKSDEEAGQISSGAFPFPTAKIPPGGYLQAMWFRKTTQQASADKFEFIITAPHNKLICRWKSKPTTPKGRLNSYVQVVYIPLPKLLPQFTHVTVKEAAAGKNFMYLIMPQGFQSGIIEEVKPH